MVTDILCIGTEVLMGNIVNTNAQNISKICIKNGHYVLHHHVVGDNYKRAFNMVKSSLKQCECIIISGGLGPTDDDITLKVVSDVIGAKLVYSKKAEEHIKCFLNLDKLETNLFKQTYIINGATLLYNDNGTALGQLIKYDNKIIIIIPGPPNECLPMLENYAMPLLKDYADVPVYSKMVKITNIEESTAANMIDDIIKKQTDPTIAPYCKFMEVDFRISSAASSEEEANNKIDNVIDILKKNFNNNIFAYDEKEFIEDDIYRLLNEFGYRISVAESCTGGLLSSKLVNIPGISKFFNSGYITYSDEAKIKELKVNKDTLIKYSAVSINVVNEMIEGLIDKTSANVCIAISGVAGPGNDNRNNEEGKIIIGTFVKNKDKMINTYYFNGSRTENINMATKAALIQLRNHILDLNNNYLRIYTK